VGAADEKANIEQGASVTDVERRVREGFEASVKIDLDPSESIDGACLQHLCREAWRGGASNSLIISGGKICGDLHLDRLRTDGALELRGVDLERLWLTRSSFGVVVLSGCHLKRIEAAGLQTAQSLDLNRYSGSKRCFVCEERVRLVVADIGGDLNCEHGRFSRSQRDRERGRSALIFDAASVGGDVILRDSVADGWVSASRVRVGGGFKCTRAKLRNDQGGALNLKNARVEQGGGFDVGEANGAIDLSGATFGGAVKVSGVTIRGDLLLGGVTAGDVTIDRVKLERWEPDPQKKHAKERVASEGKAVLSGANLASAQVKDLEVAGVFEAVNTEIAGSLSLCKLTVRGPTIDLTQLDVARTFSACQIRATGDKSETCLVGVRAGTLADGPAAWPSREGQDKLRIDDLSIARLDDKKHLDWRIGWLRANSIWTPQPWQEVSAALRRIGSVEEARRVAFEREKELTRRGGFGVFAGFWRRLIASTIGYGYRPWFAAWWAIGIVLIFWPLYGVKDFDGQAGAPQRESFLYSLDAFVPIDLGYYSAWAPRNALVSAAAGLEAVSGWVLTALLLGALTGLVKKD
jgi:hypothetical protein